MLFPICPGARLGKINIAPVFKDLHKGVLLSVLICLLYRIAPAGARCTGTFLLFGGCTKSTLKKFVIVPGFYIIEYLLYIIYIIYIFLQ